MDSRLRGSDDHIADQHTPSSRSGRVHRFPPPERHQSIFSIKNREVHTVQTQNFSIISGKSLIDKIDQSPPPRPAKSPAVARVWHNPGRVGQGEVWGVENNNIPNS
jgi:hypothetical protein